MIIADIHDALDKVKALRSVDRDAALVAGDFTYSWSAESARRALEELAAGSPVFYVAGNMDPDISSLAVEGARYIHGIVAELEEYKLAGLSYVDDGGAAEVLRRYVGARPLIVLSHAPPRGVLDKTFAGTHIGSRALRDFAEREAPVLIASGHVHEARGVERLGKTVVVNAGPLMRGYYAVAELRGWEAEVETKRI